MKTETIPLIERIEVEWNDDLRRLYQRFPSILRSKLWPDIQKMVLSGDVDGATKKAQELEDRSPAAKVENISANRLRLQRVALFRRLSQAERALRVAFNRIGNSIEKKILKKATGTGKTDTLLNDIDDTTKEVKVEMRKWLRRLLRDSSLLALRNAGNAFEPLLKDKVNVSKEAMGRFEVERMLLEAPRNFPTKNTKRFKAKVNIFSQKWRGVTKRIVKTILKSNTLGLRAEQRIVELTSRMNNEMRRILANDIAQGKAPANIATKLKKFVSPQIVTATERGEVLPRGVYRSTFKNAMRLARTEANKAYTHASAAWAEDKPFVEGVKITLSPRHQNTDICDSLAARGTITPEEFQSLIPAHPHCMCYPTYVIKDRFLDKEAA